MPNVSLSMPPAEHSNGAVLRKRTTTRGPAADASAHSLVETLAVLALGRMAARLNASGCRPCPGGDPVSGPQFFEGHREAVLEGLRRAVRRALLALEVSLGGELLWDRVAADLPREPRQLLLPQAWALREVFMRAGAVHGNPAAERLALRLRGLRETGALYGDDAPETSDYFARASTLLAEHSVFADAEIEVIQPAALKMRHADEESLACLLGLRSRRDEFLLVGLVDYFLCRALQADPRISGAFVFVHMQRPEDLWEGDVETLARIVEQHVVRLTALLDDAPPAQNGRSAARGDAEVERLFQQGLDCYLSADYQRAVMLFTAALRRDPGHAALYAYRGDGYRLLCEYDLAVADYTAALRLNPASPAVLIQRAAVHRLREDLARAVADCSAAIAIDPKQAGAYTGRGDAHLELDALDDAIADYTAAIGLQPYSPWAYYGRGQAHLRQEAYEKAIADCGQVLALNPQHVLAQLLRGDACRGMGDLAHAILDYSEVLRHHPRNAAAYARRGLAFEQKGDISRAIGDYTQALRLDAKNAHVYCSRGILLRRKGELERALNDLDESIRHDAENATAHHNRGLIFMARGLFKEALGDFDRALKLSPELIACRLARALAHDRLGRQSEGIQDCSRALTHDEGCIAAYLIRGVIASHADQYAQALADLTHAIEMDPNLPLAYHERGMVFMLQAEYERAIADYTRMLELNPASALAYAARGVVRQLQGQHDLALADFAKALELNPQSILAGWHQNLAEGIRRRTTQMLVDYIEGVWPRQAPVREAQNSQAEAPGAAIGASPDGAETAEYPAVEPPPIPPTAGDAPRRRLRRKSAAPATAAQAPAEEAQASDISLDATALTPEAAATDDDSAADVLLQSDAVSEAPSAVSEGSSTAASAETAGDEPPAPPPMLVQCPTCKAIAVPSERLPDRRVRCGSCQSAFLPGRLPSLTATGSSTASRTAASSSATALQAKQKKPRRADDDTDDWDGPRFTLKQKITVGTAAALVGFVLLYYFFPSFDGSSSKTLPIAAKLTADDLLKEYSKNRIEAAKKFNGLIHVSGEVAQISDRGIRVRFKTDGGTRFVEAVFDGLTDEVKSLQKNQKITVRGECEGWQKNVVELSLCRVVPNVDKTQ